MPKTYKIRSELGAFNQEIVTQLLEPNVPSAPSDFTCLPKGYIPTSHVFLC